MRMTLEEAKNLVRNGLKYLEYPNNERVDINMELLINIRKFIFEQSNTVYYERFPDAYNYDIGIDRKREDTYYDEDGIRYYFDSNMEKLEAYTLCGGEYKELDSPIKCNWTFHYQKTEDKKERRCFLYNYINEIDHFFTYCINNILKNENKEKGYVCYFDSVKDRGVKSIKETIEKYINNFGEN